MKAKVQLLVAVLLLGAAGWMLRGMFAGPKINLGPYQALGVVAAEEAAGLAGGKGKLVLVILDNGRDGDPVQDAQVAAFSAELKKQAGEVNSVTEKVAMDAFTRMGTGGAIPPARYLALRKKHADAALFVLFLPFPPLSDSELSEVSVGKAKVMVVSAALPGYEGLLKKGAFQLAIVSRPPGDDGPAVTGTPAARSIFDKDYLIWK